MSTTAVSPETSQERLGGRFGASHTAFTNYYRVLRLAYGLRELFQQQRGDRTTGVWGKALTLEAIDATHFPNSMVGRSCLYADGDQITGVDGDFLRSELRALGIQREEALRLIPKPEDDSLTNTPIQDVRVTELLSCVHTHLSRATLAVGEAIAAVRRDGGLQHKFPGREGSVRV